MPFDWILFDLDGTLWDHERASSEAVLALCQRFNMSPVTFYPMFRAANDSVWQELIAGRIDFDRLRVRRFEMILEEMGRAAPSHDPAELSNFYLSKYLEQTCYLPGAREVVREAAAIAPIAILTNAPHRTQDVKLGYLGEEANLFRAMICADDVEVLKPDRLFFQRAASQLGLKSKDRILMVGDSWDGDLAVPRVMGWDTAWISHGRQPPSETSDTMIFHDLEAFGGYLRKSGKSLESQE